MVFPSGDENPVEVTPVVTWAIAGVMTVVWVFAVGLVGEGFLISDGLTSSPGVLVPARATPVDIFTSLFVHAGIVAFVFNVAFLLVMGDNVEDEFGHFAYLAFYLIFGVVGSAVYIIVAPLPETPIFGAGPAVSGIVGVYVVLYPHARVEYTLGRRFNRIKFHVRAIWVVAGYCAVQLLIPLLAGGFDWKASGLLSVAFRGYSVLANCVGLLLGAAVGYGALQLDSIEGGAPGPYDDV